MYRYAIVSICIDMLLSWRLKFLKRQYISSRSVLYSPLISEYKKQFNNIKIIADFQEINFPSKFNRRIVLSKILFVPNRSFGTNFGAVLEKPKTKFVLESRKTEWSVFD